MPDAESILPVHRPGDQVGAFQIERRLGAGAFADVYLARNIHLDQRVALKVIRRTESEDREREGARMMCRLQHPNIVAVRFADRIDGRLVIAMDYVDGETLAAQLRVAGTFELQRAMDIAASVCRALEYVHDECGMAHLDLKPSNLLIDRSGAVRITDFGVAQWLREPGAADITGGGSPAYMAPEQFEGCPSAQSDLWAVGVLLCQMLTGETPYQESTVEGYREAVCSRPTSFGARFSDVPEEVQAIVRRCLQRDPARRFLSAHELGTALAPAGPFSVSACAVCGTRLPPGSDICPECTLAEAPKSKKVGRWLSSSPQKKHRRPWAWIAAAVVSCALAPGVYLAARRIGFAPRQETSAIEAWNRILRLEASQEGTYNDRLLALRSFPASFPRSALGPEAVRKLEDWEQDYILYSAAEQTEKQSGAKICYALAQWTAFVDRSKTGFRRAYGESRVQFWTNELRRYTGYAELTVISAAGLPPFDAKIFGHLRPDPYFTLLQTGKELYRSRLLKKDPSPVWNEKTRVFLRPDLDLTLEIRDSRMVGSGLLMRRNLAPLPPDGVFRIAEGSIEAALEIRRER